MVFADEVQRRYGEQGIVSISLNPGNLKTELTRYAKGPAIWLLVRPLVEPQRDVEC